MKTQKNTPFRTLAARGLLGLVALLMLAAGAPAGAQTKSPKRGLAYGYHSAADL